jgi:predicted RecA/RadA family phage recombinase
MFTMIVLIGAAALALGIFVSGEYKGEGKRITWLNEQSTDRTAGDVIVLAVRAIGVCVDTIAGGEEGSVDVWGCFELPATVADTWQAGEQLYWNTSTSKLTNAATTHVRAGMAASKKYALASVALVNLNLNVD